MSKELLISLILGAVLLFCIALGIFQSTLLSNPFFLLFGLAIILGQVIMAHLAFNQYKNLSTQTTNESMLTLPGNIKLFTLLRILRRVMLWIRLKGL